MAVLSADKSRTVLGTPVGFQAGVAASTTIYAGALLAFDAGGDLIPATDTAALAIAGIAQEFVNNSAGADGDLQCTVQEGHGEWLNHTGLVSADLLKNVFVSDDNTVTDATTASNNLKVGKLLALSGSTALVLIGRFAAVDSA